MNKGWGVGGGRWGDITVGAEVYGRTAVGNYTLLQDVSQGNVKICGFSLGRYIYLNSVVCQGPVKGVSIIQEEDIKLNY